MSYQCDWSLELPVPVGGQIITYCPDVDCVLSLDERGDLFKVGFKPTHGNDLVWVFSGAIWDIANEALARERSHIMDLCEIPSDVRFPPVERPEYSGAEYVPAMTI